MKTINKHKAKELIKESKGLIFSALFVKTGKPAPYKANDYNLLHVYDMRKKEFRMLNFNTLLTLSINKTKYKINNNNNNNNIKQWQN